MSDPRRMPNSERWAQGYWAQVRRIATDWYRDRETVKQALARPKPEKARHRMHPIYLACMDCGRTEEHIALDEYRPCMEIER